VPQPSGLLATSQLITVIPLLFEYQNDDLAFDSPAIVTTLEGIYIDDKLQ